MKLILLVMVCAVAALGQCVNVNQVVLQNVNSSLALTVAANSTTNGGGLLQAPYTTNKAAQWAIAPVNGLFLAQNAAGAVVVYRCTGGMATLVYTSPLFADAEIPAGVVDGTNRVFTLAHVPSNTPLIVLDGVVLREGPTSDFVRNGATITFNGNAYFPSRPTLDIFQAWYRY